MRLINREKRPSGYLLIEMLLALVVTGILVTGIFRLFVRQTENYTTKRVDVALRQNLRSAMDMLVQDIRMAGFLTYHDRKVYLQAYDWDPRSAGKDNMIPFLYGIDNIEGISHYADNTDEIVIVKASSARRVLAAGEKAMAHGDKLELNHLRLDNKGEVDLNERGRRFGLLVKQDLSTASLFIVNHIVGSSITVGRRFLEDYAEGDIIARVDLIIYRVDSANTSFPNSVLERKNAGNGDAFQVVAEDIVDLQCVYRLGDGSTLNAPDGFEHLVRGVDITLTGEKLFSKGANLRRSLTSFIRIGNAL